jgi:DNA-binding response OmpR family regulator
MATRILIIDSDISLSTVLGDYLASRGYKAQRVSDGRTGLEVLSNEHWDVVLTELQSIGMNGYELLKDIRHRLPNIPLIVLTTRSDREDQMRAFQLGCDDYQTKPFTMDILICRIEAILRRVRAYEESKQRIFDLNGHVFDATHQTFNGQHLSSRESDLLLMLCRNEGEVVDRHRILSALWKEDNAFTSRSLGVYINHLRQFLTPAGYQIIAARYKGYKLVCNEHMGLMME